MTRDLLVHPDALRGQVRGKYREVAIDRVRFIRRRRPGRPRRLRRRRRHDPRDAGQVTPTAEALALEHVQFRAGLAEALPVPDGWADVVISNGVINLCADKQAAFAEIFRVLRPGGLVVPIEVGDLSTIGSLPPTPYATRIKSWLVEAFAKAGFSALAIRHRK